jgi:hypothetical protein
VIRRESFDLYVLDVSLPDGDGLEGFAYESWLILELQPARFRVSELGLVVVLPSEL